MEVTEFHVLADQVLENLAEKIEKADSEGSLEIDLHDGILSIITESGGEYVINKHQATQKIWVSSPKSGAAYFIYNENTKKWQDKELVLEDLIIEELKEYVDF